MTELRSLPTELNGRMYRSMLEAKWASFFTDIGLKFEYEPGSFNGWLPDFAIPPARDDLKRVYVEVKPTFNFPESAAHKAMEAIVSSELSSLTDNMLSEITTAKVKASIKKAFSQSRILLVGYQPLLIDDLVCIGWITREFAGDKIDPGYFSYDDINELFEPYPMYIGHKEYSWEFVINTWNISANKVQWNPVESVGLTVNGEPL